MAIVEDLAALHAGEIDLVRRNDAGARLTGGSFVGRDVYEATLQGADLSLADLSRCILGRAKLLLMRAPGATLVDISARRTVFGCVDLSNADLRRAVLLGSIFSKVDLRGADLRGANFTAATFSDGTTLQDCIVDETTRFDSARVSGTITAQSAFRFYKSLEGLLIRCTALDRAPSEDTAAVPEDLRRAAAREIDGLLRSLTEFAPIGHVTAPGHAAQLPFAAEIHTTLVARIKTARAELQHADPHHDRLVETQAMVKVAAEKLMVWVGWKVAQAASQFSETASLEAPPSAAAASGLNCFRHCEGVWAGLRLITKA